MAAASTIFVFNLNSKQANGTADPFDAITETPSIVSNHANIVRVNVPPGANYLDLFHEFTGSTPATRPKVRVFGRFPPRIVDGNASSNYPSGVNSPTWPCDIDAATYANVSTDREAADWLPLTSTEGDTLIEIGNATDPVAMQHNDGTRTSKRTGPSTIRLRGALEVLVFIDTAAATPTTGLIAGTFGA